MESINLDSSCLDSVEYDEDTQEMILYFVEGGVYSYSGVERSVFDRLVKTGSPGKYYANHIRDYYYYTRL